MYVFMLYCVRSFIYAFIFSRILFHSRTLSPSSHSMPRFGVPMESCVTDLSPRGVVNWAHWGAYNYSQAENKRQFYPVGMAGGPGLLVPQLRMHPDSEGHNNTDLSTWKGQFWPSDRAAFSWHGGHPVPDTHARPARAGVFSFEGTFVLTLDAPPPGVTYKLTLYTALHDYANHRVRNASDDMEWVNGVSLRITPVGLDTSHAPIEHTLHHVDGANNNAKNTAYDVIYELPIRVEFGVTKETMECNLDLARGRCAWASLMAATIQRFTPGVTGGIMLRSIKIY